MAVLEESTDLIGKDRKMATLVDGAVDLGDVGLVAVVEAAEVGDEAAENNNNLK